MKRALSLIIASLVILMLTSACTKQWDTPGQIDSSTAKSQVEEVKVLDDVIVPASFNWKTMKEVEIQVSGTTDGIIEASSTAGVVYQKAFLSKDQPYTMKLSLPAYESKIRLKKDDKSELISLNSGSVSYSFN